MSASETGACIETNTVTTRAAVHFNLSSIWLEAGSGVFGRDTALNGKATLGDGLLSETELRERCTCSNLNLRRNNVDARDLLWLAMSLIVASQNIILE